jgi:hypothetical protein
MRLYAVYDLSWQDGQWHVHIRCQTCQKKVSHPAHELAARYKASTLTELQGRLVCACGARKPWVWAMSEPATD